MSPVDYDWMNYINKKAALKEQFPPLRKVIRERPGSATDMEAQRLVREMTQMQRAREQLAAWEARGQRVAEQLERSERAKVSAAYRAAQKAKREAAA